MLIDIDKIKVENRIRKDLGNLQELADDIRENGLINPPVVTPEYTLIAGERRLRACKLLGYQQVEVRVMTVKDYEHQLKLEISENENRKEFTFSERVEWAKRLEQIERIKANERMKNPTKNSSEGETAEIVAQESGFGSKDTYRKAKFISECADPDIIQKLNEEKISIHRAYQETKQRLEDEIQRLTEDNAALRQANKELEKKTEHPKVIEKEVVSPEAQMAVRELDRVKAENKRLKFELEAVKSTPRDERLDLEAKVSTFTGRIKEFLIQMAPLGYLGHEVIRTSPQAQREYENAIKALEKWCQDMRDAMVRPQESKIIEMEVIQ
ncbi:MAG: ParB N-terminal domain-containing protein [Peptococcaceae bacterium]|nr:ParB N-terminal domain-containing protein [Peptococcaceae bacterium]